MDLTEPRPPITMGGETFPLWHRLSKANAKAWLPPALMAIIMDDDRAASYMGKLGQYVPGELEDGTAVEFYISSIQWIRANEHEVQVIPEVRPSEDVL